MEFINETVERASSGRRASSGTADHALIFFYQWHSPSSFDVIADSVPSGNACVCKMHAIKEILGDFHGNELPLWFIRMSGGDFL